MATTPSRFFWYQLNTPDVAVAEAFYRSVVGWTSEPFDNSPNGYVVVKAGERGVGGIMTADPGVAPQWIGYIYAADVDAATASVKAAGGSVQQPPWDTPGVGRISAVTDPQGASFMLMKPNGEDQPPVPPTAPGHIGWHEFYADDWQAAFDFYASQFGWTKDEPLDMGAMGTYQLFAAGGPAIGGMMNLPEGAPPMGWVFYFNVDAVDAAAKRITDGGGAIMMGPMEVPGGGWIVQATDPHGAVFAVTAPHR